MDYLAIAKQAKADFQKGRQGRVEPAADVTEGPIIAVLMDSELLGAPIWFALVDSWRPDDGDPTPVFYASELPFLRTKSPATLREVFKVKTAFGGGRVRQ